jgi:hypothetical protein
MNQKFAQSQERLFILYLKKKKTISFRLKKRTLRSKVKKKIDEIPCECEKLLKLDSKISDIRDKYNKFKDQAFLKSIKEEDFPKRNFIHSRFSEKEYFPNLKEINLRKILTAPNLHLKKEKNIVKKICEHLDKNEMLEVFFPSIASYLFIFA